MTKIRNPEDVRPHPNSKYKDTFPQELIDKMSMGAFDYEIYSDWNISKDCFYRWKEEYPELKEAYEIGYAKCHKWWTTEGKQRFAERDEKGFKYWISIMNNKFNWGKDENKTNTTNNTQINITNTIQYEGKSSEELLKLVNHKLEKMALPKLPEVKVIDVKSE